LGHLALPFRAAFGGVGGNVVIEGDFAIGVDLWALFLVLDVKPDGGGAGCDVDTAIFGPRAKDRPIGGEGLVKLGLIARYGLLGGEEVATGAISVRASVAGVSAQRSATICKISISVICFS
jgi:hypothetical protein